MCLLRGTDWVFIYNSTFCPHSVFMCFVWIWEQTAIISLYSINWLVFLTETQCFQSASQSGIRPFIRSFIQSVSHSVGQPFIQSTIQSAIYSFIQSVSQRFGHSFIHSVSQSAIQSVSHSFSHSVRHSFSHSVSQSVCVNALMVPHAFPYISYTIPLLYLNFRVTRQWRSI